MSDYAGTSSDLSEIEDGAGLKSDGGSNISDHEADPDAESAPETEAETERLEISPQKSRNANGAMDATTATDATLSNLPDEDAEDTPQPGLTAQDILGDGPGTSDEDDVDHKGSLSNNVEAPELASPGLRGEKRKRAPSTLVPVVDASLSASPAKKRVGSMRSDRKPLNPTKEAIPTESIDDEQAVVDESSADEGEDLENGARGISQRDTPNLNEDEDVAVNENLEEEEDTELPGEVDDENVDVEADATVKTEDELAKKKVAMDALIPIEKLFAIFRDKLFDERWAELSAELEVLQAPDTMHSDYLAMRQALDTRRDEKLQLEQVTLGYKTKALENRILAERAQLHSQYYQTVREVRQKYMDRLNEQFSQIQRERRQCKTKEPHYAYTFEPRRSKQIIHQTAYNTEVSLLAGIARHVGFPAAPDVRGASQQDTEEDLRQMKIQIRSSSRPVTSQIARAEEAAAEVSFLEKTPWANPRHPAHQHARIDRNFSDPSMPPASTPGNRVVDSYRAPAASSSTIGVASDPPSGPAYSDIIPNGSPPLDQIKRRDEDRQRHEPIYNHNSSDTSAFRGKLNYSLEPASTQQVYEPASMPPNPSEDNTTTSNSIYNPRSLGHESPRLPPPDRAQGEKRTPYDLARDTQERYQSPPLAPRDPRFGPTHDNISTNVGITRPFGVR